MLDNCPETCRWKHAADKLQSYRAGEGEEEHVDEDGGTASKEELEAAWKRALERGCQAATYVV